MKKLVAAFIGMIVVCFAATTVSAEEYEVQKGDNLWTIAKNNNTTVEVLMNINELKDSLIYPKQILEIEEPEPEYYIIQEGDTLSQISRDQSTDVSIEELKEWNELSSDLIIIGQKLVVDNFDTFEEASLTASGEPESETSVFEIASAEESISGKESDEQETATDSTQKVEANARSEDQEKDQEKTIEQSKRKTISVESTAYTAGCSGCSGITATGINLNNNPYEKVIAVDPNVIPLGTKVYVEGYGYAVAGDTGGAIKGYKIDVHLPTKSEAYSWGRRTVELTILE
ncbi:3D domain-containing protein [Oceanobacillus massiliensis]|uniref:3D domain-containing protein n=1 Tax=Oceanobacillus massiliensis TaxID=1465765 RepID=UPI000289DBD9|nr:3D domain-containing protein [Oceanobacillus massiliensis]